MSDLNSLAERVGCTRFSDQVAIKLRRLINKANCPLENNSRLKDISAKCWGGGRTLIEDAITWNQFAKSRLSELREADG